MSLGVSVDVFRLSKDDGESSDLREVSAGVASGMAVELHMRSQRIAMLEMDPRRERKYFGGRIEGEQRVQSRGGRSRRASRRMLTLLEEKKLERKRAIERKAMVSHPVDEGGRTSGSCDMTVATP